MNCQKCGNQVEPDAVFCDQCGARLVPAAADAAPAALVSPAAPVETRCSACGASITPGELFCGECGAPLAAPQPEAGVVAPAPVAPAEAQTTPAAAGAQCPDCGATVAPDDEFCYACGSDLRQRAAQQAAAPVVAPAVEQPAPQPEAPVQPAVDATQPAVAALPSLECPACGATVKVSDAFCEYCGAALQGAPVTAAQPSAATPPAAPAAVPSGAGQLRLLVVGSGLEIPLPASAEIIVGREDPYSGIMPDVDLTPHGAEEGGVSRRHFKISLVSGQYLIEDLNSTNFTLLNRQRLQPGTPLALADGDEIRAGRVRLVFKAS